MGLFDDIFSFGGLFGGLFGGGGGSAPPPPAPPQGIPEPSPGDNRLEPPTIPEVQEEAPDIPIAEPRPDAGRSPGPHRFLHFENFGELQEAVTSGGLLAGGAIGLALAEGSAAERENRELAQIFESDFQIPFSVDSLGGVSEPSLLGGATVIDELGFRRPIDIASFEPDAFELHCRKMRVLDGNRTVGYLDPRCIARSRVPR